MCARLNVLVSSRHNGPAFIAVSTSSMPEKAVPISAAEVSIPSIGIRFDDMRLEIERRNCRLSIIDAAERLTLIDASPFLAADYSWRVFHTSAKQRQFSVIPILRLL